MSRSTCSVAIREGHGEIPALAERYIPGTLNEWGKTGRCYRICDASGFREGQAEPRPNPEEAGQSENGFGTNEERGVVEAEVNPSKR